MQGRSQQSHLLSIQAIIQKNQCANKSSGMIPSDIKKLFLNKLVTNNPTKIQPKKSNFYLQTKIYEQNTSRPENKNIPSLPPRPNKSKSLNNSNSAKRNEAVHSTRDPKPNKKRPIELIVTRQSLNEAIPTYKSTIYTQQSQKQKAMRTLTVEEKFVHRQQFAQATNSSHKLTRQHSMEQQQKKLNKIQYKFVPPPQPKNKQKKSFTKTQQNFGYPQNFVSIQNEKDTLKTPEAQKESSNGKKETTGISFYKKKFKNSIEVIPDFVMAAIEGDIKRQQIMGRTQNRQESSQKKEKKQKKAMVQFNFQEFQRKKKDSINFPPRQVKQSNCVIQMKKKIQYHKSKRSEESVDQRLQPKMQFLKVIKKSQQRGSTERLTIEKKKQYVKEKQKRRRAMTNEKPRRKRLVLEEDVCGWEVNDGPMFQDYY